MNTISRSSTTLTFDEDMVWTDELTWTPVVQSREYTITGAQVIEVGEKQAGRSITLAGSEESSWMSRADLDVLRGWLASPLAVMTLTWDGVARTVAFDHERGGIEARPLFPYSDPQPTDRYVVTLRFIET